MASPSLSFHPDQIQLAVGDQTNIDVYQDPAGFSLVGADLVIRFDPKLVRIDQTIDMRVYSHQTGMILDNKSGLLKWSLSNNYGIYTTSATKIASLKLTAVGSGPTALRFEFTPGKTQDTNLVAIHGKDVLTSVTSAEINPSAVLGAHTVAPLTLPTLPYAITLWPILVLGIACILAGSLTMVGIQLKNYT